MTDNSNSQKARSLAGLSIVVLGGGIGGLAAALAFAQRGAKVRVFEQASELKEVGAGIQVTPNGAVVLRALGLGEAAEARAIRAEALEPMDALSGRRIARFGLDKLGGDPYRFFHRADLLDILAKGCTDAGVEITLSARAIEVTEEGQVSFENGETTQGNLIVGADGLHSVTRKLLNGADAPFFTGQVAWRAVVEAGETPSVARIWMAPGRHVVTYPLKGGRMNIVAVQERSDWAAEGWNFFDDPEVLRSVFTDCSDDLCALLARVNAPRLWGLFRHPVAKRWYGGNVVLLGDAAHPTLPFLAQGANLALEDAYTLARTIAEHGLRGGLPAYQHARHTRVERAIAVANANAANYHLDGVQRRAAHLALGALGMVAPKLFLTRLDWLYRFDVTA